MDIQEVNVLYRKINNLSASKFVCWHFVAGMGFGDWEKWWTAQPEQRPVGHEGIDFFWYEECHGLAHVQGGEKVPCCASGTVMARCPDFLGESLFVVDGQGVCLIYSHITPCLRVGDTIARGDGLGVIAGTRGAVPPHLHISCFRPGDDISWPEVDWNWLHDQQIAWKEPFSGVRKK